VRACWWTVVVLVLAACAAESTTRRVAWVAPVGPAPGTCARAPSVGARVGFRHAATRLAAALGSPRHRAADLVAAEGEDQIIAGDLGFGAMDKEAEDEDVEIYACVDGSWRLLGATRSDGEGRFALAVPRAARLPAGLHELAVSLPGDRSGTAFTGLVAAAGTRIVVCDVDGTLTESENEIVEQLANHEAPAARPAAARALAELAARGYQPIYVTARPRALAELTERWLAARGMPRGPVILAPHLALPGSAALVAKHDTLARLGAAGFVLAIGIGNRATDVQAYETAGVAADCILIQTSEYAGEVKPLVARGRATGFRSYDELVGLATRCAALRTD
jgi:phosphatidate phosphatase PAH1